jgi:hypothetical protein
MECEMVLEVKKEMAAAGYLYRMKPRLTLS